MNCAISLRWFGRKDTNCTNCYKFNKGIDTNYTNYHEGLRQRVQPIGVGFVKFVSYERSLVAGTDVKGIRYRRA